MAKKPFDFSRSANYEAPAGTTVRDISSLAVGGRTPAFNLLPKKPTSASSPTFPSSSQQQQKSTGPPSFPSFAPPPQKSMPQVDHSRGGGGSAGATTDLLVSIGGSLDKANQAIRELGNKQNTQFLEVKGMISELRAEDQRARIAELEAKVANLERAISRHGQGNAGISAPRGDPDIYEEEKPRQVEIIDARDNQPEDEEQARQLREIAERLNRSTITDEQ